MYFEAPAWAIVGVVVAVIALLALVLRSRRSRSRSALKVVMRRRELREELESFLGDETDAALRTEAAQTGSSHTSMQVLEATLRRVRRQTENTASTPAQRLRDGRSRSP